MKALLGFFFVSALIASVFSVNTATVVKRSDIRPAEFSASLIIDPGEIVNRSSACDVKTSSVKIPWFPEDYRIVCVDRMVSRDGEFAGLTVSDNKVIYISRTVASQDLDGVIVHEWTHAKIAETHLKDTPYWSEWLRMISHRNLVGNPYFDSPEELLANSVSFCTVYAFTLSDTYDGVSCSDVREVFPWLGLWQSVPSFSKLHFM